MRAAAFLVALVTLACSGTPEPPPQPPPPAAPATTAPDHTNDAVWGTVKTAEGAVASNALVALIPHFELEYAGDPPDVPLAIADEFGRYRFADVPPGRYGVTATAHGGAYGGVHDVKTGAPLHLDLTLGSDPIFVFGTVDDSEGSGVAGARIMAARMSENEGEVYVTRANDKGLYGIALPGGPDYFLVVDAPPRPRAYRQIAASATKQVARFQLEPAPAPRPSDDEIAKALAAQAVPLATLEPEHGVKDLEALRAMIEGARIVAVGEATHGSREFFLVRHRLLELLAELGFTVLAIEAGWSDAPPLDEYVAGGKVDARAPGAAASGGALSSESAPPAFGGSALAGLSNLYYWAPNTEEMGAVLSWMRRYNQDSAHKKKLRFQGFDVQFTSHAVAAVLAYLAKVDAKGVAAATEMLAPLRDVTAENTYPKLDRAVLDRTSQGLASLVARFDSERKPWVAKSSEAAWTIARRHVELLQRTEALYRTPDGRTGRDAAMADNVQWILEHEPPGTKIVLWGHNSHIAAQAVIGSDMGERLRKKYGKDYFTIGVTFGTGAFHAYDWSSGERPQKSDVGTITLGAPPAIGLEAALGLAHMPVFALGLRTLSDPFRAWLDSKIPMRHVGGVFRGENTAGVRCAPWRSFDALVYIDKVTASHLNPGAN